MPTFAIPALQPGDIIAFEGTGFLSNAISFFTGSNLTHCAMVFAQTKEYTVITESTIHGEKDGPQFNDLATRLRTYDANGRAWAMRLDPKVRTYLDFDAMWALAAKKIGKDKYNKIELLNFVLRDMPIAHYIPAFYKADPNKEVCSEYLAELLAEGGFPDLDPPTMTPQGIAQMKMYSDSIQIMGTPREIKKFNTV